MAKRPRRGPSELELVSIKPLTKNQEAVFSSNKNLVLCGSAGTGKSFLSCYLGLEGLADGDYSNVTIIRSAVATRDMGFMPGNDKEKSSYYEAPYYAICTELFGRGDSYELLKKKEHIKFITTSFVRGITLVNSFIVVDECQNMTMHELDSLITRIGPGCRIAFCGDFKQSDLKTNGLKQFFHVLTMMDNEFDIVEFTIEDVVRSTFVKNYLRAKETITRRAED